MHVSSKKFWQKKDKRVVNLLYKVRTQHAVSFSFCIVFLMSFDILKKCLKKLEKISFCKVLKINTRLKKFKFYVKKFLYLFVGLEKCTTFALAFGKQRGNAG